MNIHKLMDADLSVYLSVNSPRPIPTLTSVDRYNTLLNCYLAGEAQSIIIDEMSIIN